MTNNIHSIIILNEIFVGAGFTPAKNDMYNGITNNAATDNRVTDNWETDNWATNNRATARVAPTVSDIVGAYKSLVVNECLKLFNITNETMGKFWQRNYHEHIIRNEQSYVKISDYIINNPANWDNDSLQ